MNHPDFLNNLREAGVIGQGGAGFPTHVKYETAAETLIINGCECEPLLFTDQWLMQSRPEDLARAACALAGGLGARRAVLAVKEKHGELVKLLREAAPKELEIFPVRDFYPAGDEQTLVRLVTGKTVPPLGIPSALGVLVTNVGTLLAAADAQEGRPVISKTVTVNGEVKRPAVLEVPIGTPVAECIAACGGASAAKAVYVLGGPLMGRVAESCKNEAVTKTLGGIIVLPHGHPLHLNARLRVKNMRRAALAACIQCRFCTDLCPRYLNGQPFETHRVMRAFAAGAELEAAPARQALLCCECGVCELMACPMGLSPRRVNIYVKNRLRAESIAYEPGSSSISIPPHYAEYRQTPAKRLALRVGLGPYLGIRPEYREAPEPESIRLPLRQHIGVPAVPVVAVGDKVRKGDLVAEIPEGALGARLHAGISGTVTEAGEAVQIRRTVE